MEVEHCNTDDMTSDCMSKPLVGAKFCKFKSQIMNLPCTMHDSDDETITTFDLSECNMSEQFFQFNGPRVHFCKFHAIVKQQTSTMSKGRRFEDDLDRAIDQLLRALQIKIFQHFLYCPFTATVDIGSSTYYTVPIRHAYMNIDYVKEQIEIHCGILMAEQDYLQDYVTKLLPDKNFIDYGIVRNTHILTSKFYKIPWGVEHEH